MYQREFQKISTWIVWTFRKRKLPILKGLDDIIMSSDWVNTLAIIVKNFCIYTVHQGFPKCGIGYIGTLLGIFKFLWFFQKFVIVFLLTNTHYPPPHRDTWLFSKSGTSWKKLGNPSCTCIIVIIYLIIHNCNDAIIISSNFSPKKFWIWTVLPKRP